MLKRTTALAALLLAAAGAAGAQELRIGLQDDADTLDPHQSRTFVGRIVYTSLCDKLVDINTDGEIIPKLSTGWEWSADGLTLTFTLREGAVYHDGEPIDAASVVYNLNRAKTLPESRRKSEVASIASVEAVDPTTVRITLTQPDSTLLAQLSDRSGMLVSPKAAEERGADLGLNPVCSGPYKFVERVQQDRIVLEKFDEYYDAANYHFERVTFLPIPDTSVRFANLRAGDLDMIERLAATDLGAARGDGGLRVETAVSQGYQGIYVNIANGERADNPAGKDARVRRALSLSIDREALNQVVFEGAYAAGNQHVPPTSPWYDADHPVEARDVAAAKALLAEAGYPDGVDLEMSSANNPVQMQVAQVMQAMAAEAGIRLSIAAKEFATQLSDQSSGAFEVSQTGWSGRTDPDGNLHQFVTCAGGINDSKYCNPELDALLNAARASTDFAARKDAYSAAQDILSADLPVIYLYHPTWLWALNAKVEGFVPYADGMIRLAGVKSAE